MAYNGINVRQTSGYVTDAAADTYSLGEVYPVTRGGVTFGWSTSSTSSSRNRSTSYDSRLAGLVFFSHAGTARLEFDVDLPNGPGTYRIRLALGDVSNATTSQKCEIIDGSTVRGTVTGSTSAGAFLDATNVSRATPAAWVSDNAYLEAEFTTGVLTLSLGQSAAGSTAVAHVAWEYQGAPTFSTQPPQMTGGFFDLTGGTS